MAAEAASQIHEIGDGRLRYWSCVVANPPAVLARLLEEVRWAQPRVRVFGREHPIPRLSAWYGDPAARYAYSGLQLEPLPWTPLLGGLRRCVEAHCGERFNGVLLNRYRSGMDAIGWHSDNEPELGPAPPVAALSLGAERRFLLRHRQQRDRRLELVLAGGSLLLMEPPTQRFWQHALPRTRRPVGERLSLTFRRVEAA